MAMTDQQVLQALSDAYAYYGAGVDAHREIARFMQQNNIPVGQVARLTGYSEQDVQADYDAFAQQAQQETALLAQQQAAQQAQQQAEQVRAQQIGRIRPLN
jgi:hypothetical protein